MLRSKIGFSTSTWKSLTRVRSAGCGNGDFTAIPLHWVPLSSFSSSIAAAAAVSAVAPENPATSSPPSPPEIENHKRPIWSKWLLFLPGAITFGLGTWQIFRRQDKIKMLEYRQKRLALEPMRFSNISPSGEHLNDMEFRRVSCKGVYDEKKSIYVGPRSRSISGVTENGYYIITPLMPIPGDPDSVKSPIMVNRGWVPRSWKDKSLDVLKEGEQPLDIKPQSARESERSVWWKFWSKKPKIIEDQVHSAMPVQVVGVIRGSEKPSIFVPENDPNSGQWFYVDVPAIARTCGLPDNTVYVEDINENVNPSNPYPVPKDVNTLIRSSVMPQDHLNYTFTWYSLSAAVTFMAFKRLKPKKNRR